MNWYPLENKRAKVINITINKDVLLQSEAEEAKVWVVEILDNFMTTFPKKYFKKQQYTSSQKQGM